jgi:hypothetical protein
MSSEITPDEVDQLLKLTMEGQIKWSLGEAIEYRNDLIRLGEKLKGTMRRKRKPIRKKMKTLRRKIRCLDHEKSNFFAAEDVIILTTGNNFWNESRVFKYRVEVYIHDDCVGLQFLKREREWTDYGTEPLYKWTVSSVTTSDKIPAVNMIPFLLRDPETTIFHEEARYGKEIL